MDKNVANVLTFIIIAAYNEHFAVVMVLIAA